MSDKICVVDDNVNNVKTAGYLLSREGYEVFGFKSGRAFLDYIDKGNTPDLVLLDIKMPDMDGFETQDELRKRSNAAAVPVIFLSADEREDTKTRGKEAGAADFIEKPFMPDVLMQSVKQAIDHSR